jgi:hypothetical protein
MDRRIVLSLLFILSLLIAVGLNQALNGSTVHNVVFSGSGKVINAASCNANDVQAAFNSVTASTTTVNIPAGTCTWTSQVVFTVPAGNTNLSIFGAGNLNTMGGGDATMIVDNYVSSNPFLIITTGVASSYFRLAGISFKGGNEGENIKSNGMVRIGGNSHNVRVDNTHFNTMTYTYNQSYRGSSVVFDQAVLGVTDHSIFNGGEVRSYQEDLFNDSSDDGYGSWANPTYLGSGNFMIFENNIFNNGGNDCTYGGRFVMRFNTFNNASLETHPTGGAGANARGCRSWEIYENLFNNSDTPPLFNVFYLSSGTGVVWGNSAPVGYEHFISIHAMRADNNTYKETPAPSGWGYCGTQVDGKGSGWDGNTNAITGYPCLDQPGRGQGDLLEGYVPTLCDVTNGACAAKDYNGTWTNEALEPVYTWLNTWNGVSGYPPTFWIVYDAGDFQQNRDYYSYNTSFNGTSGVGSGTLANRPGTCTMNVTYWVTNQGSWDTKLPAGTSGELYKCTATNTWTLFYVPYTYPAPLEGINSDTTSTTSVSTTSLSTTSTTSKATTSIISTGTTTIASTTSTILTNSTTTTIGGGGGGGTGGGGGGGGSGSSKPVIVQTNNGFVVSEIAQKNVFNVTACGENMNAIDNFITPTYSGLSVNNQEYTIEENASSMISGTNCYITLLNTSYLPIEQTITLEIYNSTPQSSSVLTNQLYKLVGTNTTTVNVSKANATFVLSNLPTIEPFEYSNLYVSAINSSSYSNPLGYKSVEVVNASVFGNASANVVVRYSYKNYSNAVVPFRLSGGIWSKVPSYEISSNSNSIEVFNQTGVGLLGLFVPSNQTTSSIVTTLTTSTFKTTLPTTTMIVKLAPQNVINYWYVILTGILAAAGLSIAVTIYKVWKKGAGKPPKGNDTKYVFPPAEEMQPPPVPP